MNPSKLLELFRDEVDDISEPYLWSDENFYTYLNDAQDVFVRMIGGLADRRSVLAKINYNAGDQFKGYDDRILRIKGCWTETNDKVVVQNLDSLEGGYMDDDYGNLTNAGLDDSLTGDVKYIITDVESGDMQLYPIPDHTGYLRLYVYRRPLKEITGSGSKLEVASFYHLNLLNWVKYKAYMNQDVEAFDASKARDFKRAFVDGVSEAKTDKLAREDRKRVVQYGGIKMS
jgi:hypothetical protein